MIVLLITTDVFMWSVSKHIEYNQVVERCFQMDTDKMSEYVIALGNYSVSPPSVTVEANLTNRGSVPARIVTLWVVDTTKNLYGIKTGLSISLNPGDVVEVEETVEVGSSIEISDSYHMWFVTERGNNVVLGESIVELARRAAISDAAVIAEEAAFTNVVYALGPIVLEHGSLEWKSLDDGTTGTYEIEAGKRDVVWSIRVTNYGEQSVTISTKSAFIGLCAEVPGQSTSWFLSQNYTLPVEETVTIEFDGVVDVPAQTGIYSIIVALYGNFEDGTLYGQSIPFEIFYAY
jgi:hypothetical protein